MKYILTMIMVATIAACTTTTPPPTNIKKASKAHATVSISYELGIMNRLSPEAKEMMENEMEAKGLKVCQQWGYSAVSSLGVTGSECADSFTSGPSREYHEDGSYTYGPPSKPLCVKTQYFTLFQCYGKENSKQ